MATPAFQLSVKADLKEFERYLTDFQKRQLPFALKDSLRDTMKGAREEVRKGMAATFNNPTPFTLNSLRYEIAKEKGRTVSGIKLPPYSGIVWVKSRFDAAKATIPPENFIRPNVFGGIRRFKRFEIALKRKGVMPKYSYAVPGQGADLDNYGNLSRGQIVQILSYFESFGESGFRANSTAKTRARLRKGTTARAKKQRRGLSYFAASAKDPKTKHLTPGIYKKTFFAFGAAITPVIIFVRRVRYRRRFDFFGIANRYASRNFRKNFERRFKQAQQSRR